MTLPANAHTKEPRSSMNAIYNEYTNKVKRKGKRRKGFIYTPIIPCR